MSAAPITATAGRDQRIDFYRLVMVALVVLLHAIPQPLPGRPSVTLPLWAMVTSTICRVAVPFFCVASGYFNAQRATLRDQVYKPVQRLAPIFLFWLAAYAALLFVFPIRPAPWGLQALIDGGPAYHLWFLPALMVALIVVATCRQRFGRPFTAALVLICAGLGPVAYAYRDVLGIGYPPAILPYTRQLAIPALVFIGMEMRAAPWQAGTASVAAVAGLALMLAEMALHQRINGHFVAYDFPVSVFLAGPAMFAWASSGDARATHPAAARLGRLSLAIYGCHLFFVWLLKLAMPGVTVSNVAATALLAFAAAALASYALQQVRFLSRFVV